MRQKLSHESGVLNFLAKKELVTSGKRGEINRLLSEFLTEHKLPIAKYNPKYKGHYDALNQNCTTVQENWNLFCKWVTLKIKQNEKRDFI